MTLPFSRVAAARSRATAPASTRCRPAPSIVATDGERLMRFRQHRDEAAFHQVVEAHAALVWGICWQVLRHREDVEDAFQATFLILARKASSIRAADSAAGWLYRVAFRTALAARQRRRRLGVEPLVEDPPALEDQLASIECSEQCEMLLEELHALPRRYRQPLILCYLEGRSRQEAADEVGVTLASVKGRLARGLRLLRTRLAYRGAALSSAAALLASEMSATQASVGAAPVAQAATLAANYVWQTLPAGGGGGSPALGAITLAKKGLVAMKIAAAVKPAFGLLAVGMTAGALAFAAGDAPSGGSLPTTTTVVELTASDGEGSATTVNAAGAADEPSDSLATTLAADAPTALNEPQPPTGLPPSAAISFTAAAPSTIAAPGQSADVLIAAPPGANPATGAPMVAPMLTTPPVDSVRLVAQPSMMPLPPTAPALAIGQSRKSLELEQSYWDLKAQGLEKKAKALRIKAEALSEGRGSTVEALETEAEADLALAEVMLCKARAQQLQEALKRLEQAGMPGSPAGDVFFYQSTNAANPQNSMPAGRWNSDAAPSASPTATTAARATPATVPEPYPQPAPQAAATVAFEPAAAVDAQRGEIAANLQELRAQLAQLAAANAQLQRQLEELKQAHDNAPVK